MNKEDIETAKIVRERDDLSRSQKITLIRQASGLCRKDAEKLYKKSGQNA